MCIMRILRNVSLIIFILLIIFMLPEWIRPKHMERVHEGSTIPHVNPCTDTLTDEDYLNHMIPHHEVAVYMSEQHLNNTNNPQLLEILRNVIWTQNYEIALMKDFLATTKTNDNIDDGMSDIKLEMDTTYTLTTGDSVKPNILEISDTFCDPTFFKIGHSLHKMTDNTYMVHMIPHHQVAVDMSKRILTTTKNDFVIFLAYRIIRAQQAEIVTLNSLLHSKYNYESSIL